MTCRGEISDLNHDINNLNSTLTSTITKVVEGLGMVKLSNFAIFNERPWVDYECKQIKKQALHALRLAEENNFFN